MVSLKPQLRYFWNLLTLVVLLSPLASPWAIYRPELASAAPLPEDKVPPTAEAPFDGWTDLFRVWVTLPNATSRARLDSLEVVVLEETETQALILADAEQLETLSRLRFRPEATDDLGMLAAHHAETAFALAQSLQPLLAQARDARALSLAADGQAVAAQTAALQRAQTDLRVALQALTVEQQAGIAALFSVDDDGDGLTNTEEYWWCTDSMNPNSDGDAQGYADGQEVAALLDFTLPRAVRWGYGAPFGPPNAWPNFNNRDGSGNKICNDGDKDTIPDYAEVYMVGTRVPEESTDHDKFDDGQELFGTTFCPGDAPNPCWGTLPAGEYWNFIQVSMPNWVLPPGDNPLVAAFPVPEVYVTPGSWHVERVTTITTSQGEITEISKDYQTSVMRGESSSVADSRTWNEWEEVSEAVSRPLGGRTQMLTTASNCTPVGSLKCRAFGVVKVVGGNIVKDVVGDASKSGEHLGFVIGCAVGGPLGCLIGAGIGYVGGSLVETWSDKAPDGGWSDLTDKNDQQTNDGLGHYPPTCKPNRYVAQNSIATSEQCDITYEQNGKASVIANQNLNYQNVGASLDGIQYAISEQGTLLARGLQDIAYAISQPRLTETRTNGHSWGGAQTTTHEEYEEHTITEGQRFTTGQNWSTAWAVDSSHAANLTFEFTVKNTGTEYARELTGIVVNVYIGDDISPSISYPAWEKFPNGKLENLFPVGPNTPSGQFSVRTFITNPIALTLEQMKRIDLGERLTVKVESYSYGADELFYTNAVTGGVTVFIEDGVDDGNETVDSYVIPTWSVESVQDVLTRFFPASYDLDGNLNALWTPEFNGINPPTWNEHYLSDIAWWNVYLTQADGGNTPLKDLAAQAGSALLFRFNRDSDRDGYKDSVELRYGTDKNDPASHPQPEVLAGYVASRSGNVVTVKLVLENSGTFDAYGIDAVMYSPDATTTIGNNTVGGNGRVRPGAHVAVGNLIKAPALNGWGSSTAKPYAGGQFTGSADRVFTFSAATPGVVGQSSTAVAWNDGAGSSGTLALGSSYHAPLPLEVVQGLQVGFNTGTIMAGSTFTVSALTPRDTFTYTINNEPYTPPVIVVSYSDPQGSHRFVTPAELPTMDSSLAPYTGQMLKGLALEVATTAPVNTTGANVTDLIVSNPHPAAIENGHLYVNFVADGRLVAELPFTLTLPAGPTVFPITWATSVFSETYNSEADNVLIAFWTDSEGNIIDSAARPLNTFAPDPRPTLAMAPNVLWDFGSAVQGTILKRTFDLANTGYLDLLTYVNAPAGVTLSQQGSRSVGPADVTTYEITLDTAGMPLEAYDQTITIRSSDPALPVRTVRVLGMVTAASCDGFLGEYFSNQTLSGAPALTRCDGLLDFNWGADSPDPAIPVNQFSARWTKRIMVHSAGNYRFDVRSDDGVRIYVDNQLVVDSWIDQGFLFASGSKALTAGEHDLRVEWYENAGGAAIHLVYGLEGTRMYPLDWPVSVTSGTQGQWIQYTHTLGPTPQTLHPVKVYSQNYATLWGVGKYATPFGSGTASYDMFGNGRDGVMPSSGNLDNNNGVGVGVVNSGSQGAYSISVTDAYAGWRINPDDVVLIHQTQGSGAGCWELNKAVSDFTGGTATIQLSKPLQCNYVSGGNNHAQIQRVPQYTNCPVSGTVTPLSAWNGSWGGIFAVMCSGTATISGLIDVQGLSGTRGGCCASACSIPGGRGYGFWGGNATNPEAPPRIGWTGESILGPSQHQQSAYGSGGGGGNSPDAPGGSPGGSASHATSGSNGVGGVGGNNGQGATLITGNVSLTSMTFGGGGGGGTREGCAQAGSGGGGGGIAILIGREVQVLGSIAANGGRGSNDEAASGKNYGGGGAGGSVLIRGASVQLGVNHVTASGGLVDTTFGGSGSGGLGRISVEYCESLSGSTNPAASTQKLNCYIAEQVDIYPYTSGRLNLPEDSPHTYQIQYGRKLNWSGADNKSTTLRVPAGLFTSVTLQSLVSDLPSNASFALDVGNTGSVSWSGTVSNNSENTSPNLASFFNAYWASHGAPTTGTLDVPIRVYLDRAGQVLLTNLKVTPTGSKVRYARLPAQTYSSVALNLSVGTSGSGALTVAADVGDDGTVDWTHTTTSAAYPLALTTSNLATAFNAYLAGYTGAVNVPVRFYMTPFFALSLKNFSATPFAKPDLSLTATDITFGAVTPTESDAVTITVALHNNGERAATGHTAAFYATAPEWGEWYIGSAFVPGIPAGGTAEASIVWDTLGFTGATPVRVVVDPYDRLAELDEDNNQATANLTILTRPDLEPVFAAFSNPEPVAGETVTVSLQVTNGGQVSAEAFAVGLYDGNPDDGGVLLETINLTAPGGSNTAATFTWMPTTPGLHRLFALVDRARAINESNRGNNLAWRDIYVGFAGPLLLDSGGADDPAYTPVLGYGFVDEGPADVTRNCGAAPHESYRLDTTSTGGRVVYRSDHLLPGHFYHLDVTLYKCELAGRQETIRVNGQLVAGPIDLGDGQVHRLSLLLDPALYTGRTILVEIEALNGASAIVNEVNLYDVDYRYADAGGAQDPAYPGGAWANLGRPYGWLNGVQNIAWGTLPYKSVRVNPLDSLVEYRFDGLNPTKRYNVHFTFWQPSGAARIQRVQLDGLDSGLTVNTGDFQAHRETLVVPPTTYAADGSLVVGVRRINEATDVIINEIALEEETLSRTSWCSVQETPYSTDVFGNVAMLGEAAPAGTVVEARNPRGDVVGCFVVGTAGQYGFMRIYGEDATATPPIPGMRAGELAAFRVNGAPAVATPQLYWQADYANHRVDLNADAIEGQPILLNANWNLFSFRLEPPIPTIREVLSSIEGRYDRVLGEPGAYVPILPPEFNTLKELHPGRGYYIRITGLTAATALIEGLSIPITTPIPLKEGWNWIGYLPEVTMPITCALQSIEGLYQRVLSLDKTYVPSLPDFSTLRSMEPGKGYLIFMNQPATLIYPESCTLIAEMPQKATSAICGSLNPTPKFTQLYGELLLGDHPALAGSRVEVLTPRGEIAGCFVLEQSGVVNFMHVYGEDATADPPIAGFRDGEPLTFRVNGMLVGTEPLIWHDDWASHAVALQVDVIQVYLPLVIRNQ